MLKTFVLFLLVTGSTTFAAANQDPYNTYIWNRQNLRSHQVDKGDWFEWWYYKVIQPESGRAFFFTYGVINPWDVQKTNPNNTAVIQFGDFTNQAIVSRRFPLENFEASYSETKVTIEGNEATDKRIHGRVIDDRGQEIAWDLQIQKQWAFNAMGWLMGIADISGIYWYPAQAAATMTGWIRQGEETLKFENAPAYQDRNWGRDFPKWWTWLTSNGFSGFPDSVLAVGGGQPKVFNAVYLNGQLCIGLKHQGREYKFRSGDMDRFNFDINWGKWSIAAENKAGQRIEITAGAPEDRFMDIQFYSPKGELFHDYEALMGHMTVKLYQWDNWSWSWKKMAELESNQAGVEWGSPEPIASFGLQNFHYSSGQ